jgi:hypothetical protein
MDSYEATLETDGSYGSSPTISGIGSAGTESKL